MSDQEQVQLRIIGNLKEEIQDYELEVRDFEEVVDKLELRIEHLEKENRILSKSLRGITERLRECNDDISNAQKREAKRLRQDLLPDFYKEGETEADSKRRIQEITNEVNEMYGT